MTTIQTNAVVPHVNIGTRVREVLVTPELARDWLRHNTRNRLLRRRDVEMLARLMGAGKFVYNGDPIRFDTEGHLLDGQHRLHAVVKSGVSVPMLIVEGLPSESQQTMDQNLRRTAGDALKMDGHTYWNQQAAVAKVAMAIERKLAPGNLRANNVEIVEYVAAHPEILESVEFVSGLIGSHDYRDVIPRVIGYAHMQMAKVDRTDADDFWTSLVEMTAAYRGDPVIALGRRLGEIRRNRSRIPELELLALIYRTWNRRRSCQVAARVQMSRMDSVDQLPALR